MPDPVGCGTLYSIYTDPNGLTVNVPEEAGITVYRTSMPILSSTSTARPTISLQADYVASTDGTVMYYGPFVASPGNGSAYTGFTVADAEHATNGSVDVQGTLPSPTTRSISSSRATSRPTSTRCKRR